MKQTPLHAEHQTLDAHFTDFGGWDMPLRYSNELAEHRAVRETAGLFDLSHMGEIWVSGTDATRFLNTVLVGDFEKVATGKAKYSLLCDESGGIVDDLIVYRMSEARYLVVPNAGNSLKVAAELSTQSAGFGDLEVIDASPETALIAVQGPAAETIAREMVDEVNSQHRAVRDLVNYAWKTVKIADVEVILARTGYTGEDGFEIYVPNEHAVTVWQLALSKGEAHGIKPAGLAARDSLRLEAGMPLYGNELSTDINPFEAGLGPVVSLKKEERFVGRDALESVKAKGVSRVLVGLKGEGRRAGRGGYTVHADGRQIGVITSGQPSPTLGYPIALAYVEPQFAEVGTKVDVDLRGKPQPFEVVKLPFYKRQK